MPPTTMRIVVYDIEIYKNIFLLVAKDIRTNELFIFEISQFRDDRVALVKFLKSLELMIGFNNLTFDYPLLHFLLLQLQKNFNIKGRILVPLLKEKADKLINSDKPHYNIIWKPLIKQLDLFKIHHFDNKAKTTSLKMLEFVLRMLHIEELPFDPTHVLSDHEARQLVTYCINDVNTTERLYKEKTLEEVELRERLSAMYGMDMMNWNSPKIGEQILISIYKQRTGKREVGQTKREQIVLKNILLPYIRFESPEFKAIKEWFESKTIKETKGVFSNLSLNELGVIEPYCNYSKPMLKKGKLKTLNIVHKGFQFDFGTGGIHGSIIPGVYIAEDGYIILDIDVSSYYPNLSIKNRFYPAHLSEIFCDIYEDIYHERLRYAKNTPENKGLKLALNGSYGKSNSEFSPLYDPQYTMSITMNGQLLLCMLAEKVMAKGAQMLQMNTDGMTIKFRAELYPDIIQLCKDWEHLTKLELEYKKYSKMVIRDVNNYLAIAEDGKVKTKGCFEHVKELHKNQSMLVVPKALEAFFVKGIPVEEFIRNHNDLWDFFKRTKVDKKSQLIGKSENFELPLQRITRYYISNQGLELVKIMPPTARSKGLDRLISVDKDKLCIVANNVSDDVFGAMLQNLNYDYYIERTNRIVNAILTQQVLENDEEDELETEE